MSVLTEKRLSEICDISIGKTPSRHTMEYWNNGSFPWATISDLSKNSSLNNTKERITKKAILDNNMKIVPKGTVLMSFKLSIGKVGINQNDLYTNEAIAALNIINDNEVNRDYLAYAIKSIDFSDLGDRAAKGRTLNKKSLSNLTISLPPLPEQKRIATILDQADSLRRLRRQAIEKLNTLSQSIFYEMFGDVKTNSCGWNTVKLGDICGVGSSKRVFVSEFVENGIPFYRGTEVGKLAEGYDISPKLFIAKDHYKKLVNHTGQPQIGDLLLPSICHDGRIWQVDHENPFYFKDGRVLWIKNDSLKINSEYLKSFLKVLFLTSYSSVASGTTFSELKIINLKNLSVLFPPTELQKEYEMKVKAIDTLLDTHKKSLEQLETLFLSLQQKAFNGKL